MKIKCDTDVIRKGVFIVGNAISRKDQNTILDNIMIKAESDSIELSSPDREVSLRHKIPARPSPTGSDQRPTGRRPSVISEKSGGD